MSDYTVKIDGMKQAILLLDIIEDYDFSDEEIDLLRETKQLIQENLDDHVCYEANR